MTEPIPQEGQPITVNPPPPTPKPPTGAQIFDGFVGQMIFCVVRGIMGMAPQVPGEIVLISCCRALAKFIGEVYVGDKIKVMGFRRDCLRAFDETLNATEINTASPFTPPSAMETALPPSRIIRPGQR
jgi:hypothetical protein